METKRQWYPTKAAWAEAQAARLREREDATHENRIPSSNWRGVQAKMRGLDNLRREASRYDRMAERFKAQGV